MGEKEREIESEETGTRTDMGTQHRRGEGMQPDESQARGGKSTSKHTAHGTPLHTWLCPGLPRPPRQPLPMAAPGHRAAWRTAAGPECPARTTQTGCPQRRLQALPPHCLSVPAAQAPARPLQRRTGSVCAQGRGQRARTRVAGPPARAGRRYRVLLWGPGERGSRGPACGWCGRGRAGRLGLRRTRTGRGTAAP